MSQEALNAERRARMALERRVAEMESRVRGMWVFSNSNPWFSYRQLIVGRGNSLGTLDGVTYYGVKRGSLLATVPSATPAAIDTACADGLTAAYDLGVDTNNVTGPLVWLSAASSLKTKNPDGVGADITVTPLITAQMKDGTLIASASSYQVPISGSPGVYANVYVPYLVTV